MNNILKPKTNEEIIRGINIGKKLQDFLLLNDYVYKYNVSIGVFRDIYGFEDKNGKLHKIKEYTRYDDFIKTLNESSYDVLKPKSNKDITKNITQELMIDLMNSESISFFKIINGKFSIFRSSYSIDKWFDEVENVFKSGLYVTTFSQLEKLPLSKVFKTTKIKTKTYKIDVSRDKLELVIDELVLNALKGNINGFHVKYFEQEMNESLFVPKNKHDIMSDLVNKIYNAYKNISMTLSILFTRDVKPGLARNIVNFDYLYENHGNGIFININHNDVDIVLKTLKTITKNLRNEGPNFIIINDDNIDIEKNIIKKMCELVLDKKISKFHIRKYS